jgi:hypothetical protein
MSDSTSSTQGKLLEAIIARAWEDPDFKASLIADPRKVLKSEFGYEYPEGVNLRVIEETADERCLVLPVQQGATTDAELSDSELEVVAGGVTGTSSCTAITNSTVSSISSLSSLSCGITLSVPSFYSR